MVSNLVYYAMGGGLGHQVRARAFLHTIGYVGRAMLVTSERAKDARVTGDLELVQAPNALERDAPAFRRWLMQLLADRAADCLCVDVFPAGILGELNGSMPGLQLWHVARLLRWHEYAPLLRGDPLAFDRCWCVEPLHAEHRAFLEAHCDSVEPLELVDPPQPCAAVRETEPYWLIVHSGPRDEVSELAAFAHEIRTLEGAAVPLLVITASAPRDLPPQTRILDAFPAEAYFAGAQRIFSAAGFNVMRQTERYRFKHAVLPMQRRFDDQLERAKRARRSLRAPLA